MSIEECASMESCRWNALKVFQRREDCSRVTASSTLAVSTPLGNVYVHCFVPSDGREPWLEFTAHLGGAVDGGHLREPASAACAGVAHFDRRGVPAVSLTVFAGREEGTGRG